MIPSTRVSAVAVLGKRTHAIGKNGVLLWHVPQDMQRFKTLTTGHPVIMGRKTWESLPEHFRPLPNRSNIVITRQKKYPAQGAFVVNALEQALYLAKTCPGANEIFIIGGASIYAEALPHTNRLYLTLVDSDTQGDTFFPTYDSFRTVVEEVGIATNPPCTFVILEK